MSKWKRNDELIDTPDYVNLSDEKESKVILKPEIRSTQIDELVIEFWNDAKNQSKIDIVCNKYGLNKKTCSMANKKAMVRLITG